MVGEYYLMHGNNPAALLDEALTLHLMGLCSHALEHGLVTVEKLAAFGDERPEGYIYAYGVLKHFASTPDQMHQRWITRTMNYSPYTRQMIPTAG